MSSEPDGTELDDLQQLVTSAGFARLLTYVDEEWGPEAQMRKIDQALHELPPGDFDAERMTVAQIRAAAKRVQALVRWPQERISQLKQGAAPTRALDRLRRIAR